VANITCSAFGYPKNHELHLMFESFRMLARPPPCSTAWLSQVMAAAGTRTRHTDAPNFLHSFCVDVPSRLSLPDRRKRHAALTSLSISFLFQVL
jgi:hypothetical protein